MIQKINTDSLLHLKSYLLSLSFLCVVVTVSAQSSKEFDFRLRYFYKSPSKTSYFKISYMYDSYKGLPEKIKKDFITNLRQRHQAFYQAKENNEENELYWSASIDLSDKKRRYYHLSLYTGMNSFYQGDIYHKNGEWLYSYKTLSETPHHIKKVVNRLGEQYTASGTSTEVLHIRYHSGETYYMLEIPDYLMKKSAQPQESEFLNEDESSFALRIVMDSQGETLEKYFIFGNSTEVAEMQMSTPILLAE